MMIRFWTTMAFLCTLVLGPSIPAPAVPPATFPQGVASGDVTSNSVILWTRASQAATVTVQVATQPTFSPSAIVAAQTLNATAATDFTAKVTVTGLSPATTYFYRFTAGPRVSPVGRFRTAPFAESPTPVRFAWSSDSDGSLPFNQFEVLERARLDNPDFFVYLGDTVYMDTNPACNTTPPCETALTLDIMRSKYKQNRNFSRLRDLLAATSIYAIWDDHEVKDNFDGQTVDATLVANGRQAFEEYMPIGNWAAGTGFFRTFRWGKDLELFILDERSFRSGSVEGICGNDLAPTLPGAIRLQLGLPPAPPPGCVPALNNPARTMLGSTQKAQLKAALLGSNATWKVIVNGVAIRELFAIPYDRWEGYAAERLELLNFLTASGVKNVIVITGDLHSNLITDVPRSIFTEPAPVTKEFIAGPIAQETLFDQVVTLVGPDNADAFINLLTTLAPASCANLDSFGYGLAEIDLNKNLTVTLKGQDGNTLLDSNGVTPCTITLVPS